jgi:hypothetical protein
MFTQSGKDTMYSQLGSRERGVVLQGLLFLIVLLVGALTTVAFVFGVVVPIGHVGVRKIAFGPGQGLSAQPHLPMGS